MDAYNELFLSKYDKIDLLGEGSFGKCYLVKRNETFYALKEISMHSLTSVEKQRAFNEVSFLATLKHRYIVGYKDSAIDHISGKLSIIMDYAENGDLAGVIAKQKGIPFNVHRTVSWFIQITLALQYTHSQNILHRDLKPQNIFLCCDDTIKIGDFGISRLLNDPGDFAKTSIGTPYYLSPEVLLRKPYNRKSDVWALGCVLFEISTLERAFKAASFPELMGAILEGKRQPFPHWMTSGLIKRLVDDLLCLHADQRPSTDEILSYPFLRRYLSDSVQCTKEISSRNITRKAVVIRSGDSLKRSATVSNSNNLKLKKISPKRVENNRMQNSTRVVPTIVVTECLDKFETNKRKLRSTSTRAIPSDIVISSTESPTFLPPACKRKQRSSSTRTVSAFFPDYQDAFEANERKPRSASIRPTSYGIVDNEIKTPDKFEANERKSRSAAIPATPPDIVISESKVPLKFHENRLINKLVDKYPTSQPCISSRSNMNITYTVKEKSHFSENSKFNKLCPSSTACDIDFGYSSEEADSTDKNKNGFEHSRHQEVKTVNSSISSNQNHCGHSQCNQCLLDMMWNNRIRGCVNVSKSNGDYLKLKKKLLLVFGHDIFQKVYESLLKEWEGNESTLEQTSLKSYAKLLNYEQVQHFPLMMQLIQLDLMSLSENET